ncbi:sigma-70 family RNA polymerase sigma factor [Galbibacter pacificus]|uniref:Sigma-70 family RNA polymerase sigma factor n=1 Tax=Galbibacter pacificus TaxID=2996052 RepID=A0ABT6FRM5_9FLAO|nr:sigma-70 family RNA polymerase sigma factor [Galbibacter pacificus]MDG3581754.1 sigma-70 family RNA polymerase sigma factor [Galbibacter pacificus]MDG3585772.1 sigma-70 family RNA polymerase sigma factor [Galbibacter pacificus]
MTKIKTLKLFEQYHNTDNQIKKEKIKNNIIENHIPFVISIANKWNRKEHKQDLIQVGNIGLLRAFDGFDYNKNFSFVTYAHSFIWGEMNKYMKGKTSTIHIPMHKYYEKNETYPYKNISFNYNITSNLYEDANYIYDDLEEEEINNKRIDMCLNALNQYPKHRYIVINYMGLNVKKRSMQEIGDTLGVSRSRIYQLYNEAIELIKENVKPKQ